jgi:hypothetical protein
MYRWFRYSENPLVRFLPLLIFSPMVIFVIMFYIIFQGRDMAYLFVPALVGVLAIQIGAYLIMRRAIRRVPDNLTRLYNISFEDATERLERGMTEAGVKFMRYSIEEYREMGLIEELSRIGYRSQEPTWIYQLDASRAAVLSRVQYPKGHCNLMLFPYEDEGIYLMDKVKEAADRALGP